MTITEAIELCESMAKQDIKDLTAKDRLLFWTNIKEFNQPKMMRSTYEIEPNEDTEIVITYED